MSFLLTKINWFGTGGTDEAVELNDFISMNLNITAEAKASGVDVTLLNPLTRISGGNNLHKYIDSSGLIKFGEGDIIKVYLAYSDTTRTVDTSDTSSDLIMTAEVSEVKVSIDMKNTRITLKCVDKTYTMLNKLWAFNYDTSLNLTAPEIIQNVIRNVSDDVSTDVNSYDSSGNFVSNGIYAVDARLTTGAYPGTAGSPPAYIQNIRPTSGTFPSVTIAKTFKSAYEFIKDLSTTEKTNSQTELDTGNPPSDRNYRFYVDYDNRFHWFYPEDSQRTTLSSAVDNAVTTIPVASTTGFKINGIIQIGSELIQYTGTTANSFTGGVRGFNNTTAAAHSSGDIVSSSLIFVEGNVTTGNRIINMKVTKKTFDIINMVIFNSGQDLYGSGILNYFYDQNTNSKELKMTYKPYTEIAKDLIKKEIDDGRLTQDNSTPGVFTYAGNRYKETTGNYGGTGITTSWGTLVTTNDTYNTAVRDQSIIEGKKRAESLTRSRGNPRWKGTIEVKGKRYIAGDLITLTSTSAGINEQDLIINGIKHNITKEGWFTTLEIEETERKLGQ